MGEFSRQFRSLLVIAGTAVTAVLLNCVLIQSLGLKAYFSPTGYPSNLARIHELEAQENCQIVLLGSSITGRLLPDFFQISGREVINLGIDAGGTATSVEIFLRSGRNADLLLVEANAFRYRPTDSGKVVMDASDSLAFRLRQKFPCLWPHFQPSGVLFTALKKFNDERTGQPLRGFAPEMRPGKTILWDQEFVEGRLNELMERTGQLMIVNYPSKGQAPLAVKERFRELSDKDPRIDFIDLQSEMEGEGLLFTDQVHLTLPSARKVCERLSRIIGEQKP